MSLRKKIVQKLPQNNCTNIISFTSTHKKESMHIFK